MEPGGKEDGAHIAFISSFGFITLQLLRPAEAVIRNHTLLVDSRVKMGAKIWNESESFVVVVTFSIVFFICVGGFYCQCLIRDLWIRKYSCSVNKFRCKTSL